MKLGRWRFSSIEIMIVVVILGILTVLAIPQYAEMKLHQAERQVYENTVVLSGLVETFSYEHDGRFPLNLAELLAEVQSADSILAALRNPYARHSSVAVDSIPTTPGQLGYVIELDRHERSMGYIIFVRDLGGEVHTKNHVISWDGQEDEPEPASSRDAY